MIRTGITGGIGSGKTFVCRRLETLLGIKIYDCDAAARRIIATDEDIRRRLTRLIMGENASRTVTKREMALFLLAGESNARAVDSIVHPAVISDYNRSGMMWVESAILFECQLREYVDRVIAVTAPLDVRLRRIIRRDGISREKAMQWINLQMPQEEIDRLADIIIVNDGTADISYQIKQIWKRFYLSQDARDSTGSSHAAVAD